MNMDQLEGKWEQLKGYAREKWGKLTDNDLTEIQGRSEILKGKLIEKYGLTKEAVEEQVSSWIKQYKDKQGSNPDATKSECSESKCNH